MCGIIGVFSAQRPISREVLTRSTQVLHHRGPDQQNVWISANQKVGLGHARLSIIDLKTGEQPLSNKDGSIRCVVNGELYGFQKIRKDLEKLGHSFKTESDSEILLHLYEEYGTQCLHHLRGEFAFILWDENSRTLFAARDRFGIKPLFYAFQDRKLYLASEIKALLAMGVQAEWDHEAFHQFNHLLTTHQDRTLFKGVFQIPPGHFLLSSENQNQLLKYWDFDYAVNPTEKADPREYQVEFARLLNESIQLRLHADVPVACYLSGGLDSCSVLGLAAQKSREKITAFTLGFDHREYDESEIAKEMAEKAGAQFNLIPIRYDDLAENFSDAIWHSETIAFNAHGVSKFLLSRAVREAGFKVVLTGEGSDEVLAGYPHFRKDLFLYQASQIGPDRTEELLKALAEKNKVSSGILLAHGEVNINSGIRKLVGHFPSWMESFSSALSKFQTLFKPSFREHFKNQDGYLEFLNRLDIKNQLLDRHPVNQSMYLWSKSALPNYILSVLGDRMEMSHSIEGRVPFLDHHLVEFVRNIPVSQKISGTTEKYLLREVARPVLTQTVYERQKHPFFSPPLIFDSKSRFYHLLQDTLRSPMMRDLPFYEQGKVLDLLEKVKEMSPESKGAYDIIFTGILSACLLQERFKMATG